MKRVIDLVRGFFEIMSLDARAFERLSEDGDSIFENAFEDVVIADG